MLPFRKVLCPIDFSAQARVAVSVAVGIALASSADLVLVHVVQLLPITAPLTGLPIRASADESVLLSAAGKRLRGIARYIGPDGPPTAVRVAQGPVAPGIAFVARSEGADLIVMHRTKSNRLRRALLGSITEDVMRSVRCSVLSVHCGGDLPPEGRRLQQV